MQWLVECEMDASQDMVATSNNAIGLSRRFSWLQSQRPLSVITPAILFIMAMLVYWLTLYPTLPPGDSGELIAVPHTLGIVHAPGYPLYTMLAKAFSWLPVGTIAWRINLFSAVCNSCAALFIYLTITKLSGSRSAGFVGGAFLAFSPAIWQFAVAAEVFGLNNLLLAMLLWTTCCYWYQPDNMKWFYTGIFCVGLGAAHHHSSIFYSIPMMGLLLWQGRLKLAQTNTWLKCGVLLIVALSPYMYLPLAAHTMPRLVSAPDVGTWQGFFDHFLRRQYGTFSLNAGAQVENSFWQGTGLYLKSLLQGFSYIGVFLSLIGIYYYLLKRKSAFVWATLVGFSCYLVIFNSLQNIDIHDPLNINFLTKFWGQPNIMIALWLGLGFASCWDYFQGRWQHLVAKGWSANLIPISAAALVALQIFNHYSRQDQSQNQLYHKFGESLLNPLPANAIILSRDDLFINTLRYLIYGEGLRSDIITIERNLLAFPWHNQILKAHYPQLNIPGDFRNSRYFRPRAGSGYNLTQLIQANIANYPIFMVPFSVKETNHLKEDFDIIPYGWLDRIQPKSTPFSVDEYIAELEAFAQFDPQNFATSHRHYEPWAQSLWTYYWSLDYRAALFLVERAMTQNNNPELLQAAAGLLEGLKERHPEKPAYVYRLLGITYHYLSGQNPSFANQAATNFEIYLRLEPGDTEEKAGMLQVIKANSIKN